MLMLMHKHDLFHRAVTWLRPFLLLRFIECTSSVAVSLAGCTKRRITLQPLPPVALAAWCRLWMPAPAGTRAIPRKQKMSSGSTLLPYALVSATTMRAGVLRQLGRSCVPPLFRPGGTEVGVAGVVPANLLVSSNSNSDPGRKPTGVIALLAVFGIPRRRRLWSKTICCRWAASCCRGCSRVEIECVPKTTKRSSYQKSAPPAVSS